MVKHLWQCSEQERQLIAYEIHDGLAQYLLGAIMQLQMSEELRGESPEEAASAFEAGMAMVRKSLAEARRLISARRPPSGAQPPVLDESGVIGAVARLVADFNADRDPQVDFHSALKSARLAPILENAVYRIVQEGLTNAWKHSRSKKMGVSVVQHGKDLRIEMQDWGVGFDPQTVAGGHFGLESIHERARLLGGKAMIESTPGKGTRITVDLPIVLCKDRA